MNNRETTQKYSVNQHLIETLLVWVNSKEIAIPEIQRPFVWDAAQVRDLLDSLYQGFPVGYIIVWKNPDVRLKDGSVSSGKKVLIDGQQRITALSAALLGQKVVNKEYRQIKIRIAFNPNEQRFEVSNPAIQKDKSWIPDIAPLMKGEISLLKLIHQYTNENSLIDEDRLERIITRLTGITKKQIGVIELDAELDIEAVTEIFIRINREGVPLGPADFAMSKIAANETYGGSRLRKAIDYFCHLAVAPEFYDHIEGNDREFAGSDYFKTMRWLRNENDDLYDPSYSDMLRVAFTSQFSRGKLADLQWDEAQEQRILSAVEQTFDFVAPLVYLPTPRGRRVLSGGTRVEAGSSASWREGAVHCRNAAACAPPARRAPVRGRARRSLQPYEAWWSSRLGIFRSTGVRFF